MRTYDLPMMQRHLRMAAKALVVIAAFTGIATDSRLAQAQSNYPNKSVRIVVPYPAGNTLDIPTRMVSEHLAKSWGQVVVVENRPGSSLAIGTEVVAKARPDGYTLLSTTTSVALGPALIQNIPYDTFRDLAPITKMWDAWLYYVVDSSLGTNNLRDFITLAKANPGKYNFASFGVGTTAHLLAAKLNVDQGINIVHVPYKGSRASLLAVVSGEAQAALQSYMDAKPYIDQGKLKVLAVTGARRSPVSPETPTLDQAGVPGFANIGVWNAFFATGGTPEPILNKIASDIAEATSTQQFIDYAKSNTADVVHQTPAEFRPMFRREVEYWLNLVKTTGVKIDN